jgi:hypothetical protein
MVKTMRVVVALAALTVLSASAFAQGGGAGGGRQGGGGFGGFGGGQFGRPGANGELTTVQIPLATLTTVAKLTPEQASKVKAMQDKLDEQRKAMRPQGGFGGGGNGGGFDREAMQQMMEEMRAKQEQLKNDETKASKAIDAMLSADQSTALKAALPGLKAASSFGLLEVYSELNLTEAQVAVLTKAAKERQARMQGGGRRGGGN